MNKIQITKIPASDLSSAIGSQQYKITNISTDYVNDLKLIIDDHDHLLLEQFVKRERGSLSFSPEITCLELGNLAPEESAYFEYKLSNPNALPSFHEQISLTYDSCSPSDNCPKKIADFLLDSAKQ